MGQEQRLEDLSRRLEEMQRLSSQVLELENWRLTFERQKDEEKLQSCKLTNKP